MIQLACHSCGKKLRVKVSAAGKKIRCPGCQTVLAVPAAGGPPPPVAAPTGRKAGGSRRGRRRAPEPVPTTATCQHCRREIPADATQCLYCGSLTEVAVDRAHEPFLRRRGFDWRHTAKRVVTLVVIVVLAYLGYTYGSKFLKDLQERNRWVKVEEALDAKVGGGADRLIWEQREVIHELGPDILPHLRKKYASAKNSVVRARVLMLLAYMATQVELDDDSVQLLAEGMAESNLNAQAWSVRGLALAAGGEAALVCLRPFSGMRGDISVEVSTRNRRAREALEELEPDTTDLGFNRMLAAARVLAGDTQALSHFATFLEPVPNRGKVTDLLRRVTGKTFESPEEFTAWWEGDNGAYQRQRPEWLLEALETEPAKSQLEIILQLRALSGQNFGFNRAAPEAERQKVFESWKNWWDKSRRSWGQ